MFELDPKLREFAHGRNRDLFDAIVRTGGLRAGAASINMDPTNASKAIRALKKRAALQGYSPDHDMHKTVPDGFTVKGVSTYYDKEGQARGQWVKSAADDLRREEILRAFIDDLVSNGARGASTPVAPPERTDNATLTAYLFGDPHFGMRAMRAEAGEDFNLAEAERLMCGAIDHLVDRAPASEVGLLVEIGDFLHADDSTNATPASKNPLDVDGRFFDITQVGLRTLVYTINRMKTKHARVDAWILPGNHDPHAAWMLALCLSSFFHNDPRVNVDLTPGLYKYMRFGRNLFGAHHGHGAKIAELGLIMANDRPEDWGATDHRVFWMGHIHHKQVIELPGVVAESLNTLAPGDAWHAGRGYRSSRSTQMVVFDAVHGETERHKCDVSRLVRAKLAGHGQERPL